MCGQCGAGLLLQSERIDNVFIEGSQEVAHVIQPRSQSGSSHCRSFAPFCSAHSVGLRAPPLPPSPALPVLPALTLPSLSPLSRSPPSRRSPPALNSSLLPTPTPFSRQNTTHAHNTWEPGSRQEHTHARSPMQCAAASASARHGRGSFAVLPCSGRGIFAALCLHPIFEHGVRSRFHSPRVHLNSRLPARLAHR
jgi:hypothetical protein